MLPQKKNWWVDRQGEKRWETDQEWKSGRKRDEEAWHLLWHHLFDLWFHVAIHCFGFKTSTGREAVQCGHHTAINSSVHREGFATVISTFETSSSLFKQKVAYRVGGCNIWRKPRPWVCRGRGTGGDWDRWCGQPESEWRSLWLCRAWGSKPFFHLETKHSNHYSNITDFPPDNFQYYYSVVFTWIN